MEFSDLNDEIGADDWLISREEITRRRLIKETPRFKIYKADWFGDVLLYEPNKISKNKQSQSHLDKISTLKHDDLSARFNCLRLRLEDCAGMQSNMFCSEKTKLAECPISPTTSLYSDTGSLESGYSSTSSTPQYYTKHNSKSEFEFPSDELTSWNSMSSLVMGPSNEKTLVAEQQLNECEQSEEEPGNVASKVKSMRKAFPVVLNRDSFKFGAHWSAEENVPNDNNKCNNNELQDERYNSMHDNCWFEINELRLIAHENFMLFMGACVEDSLDECCTGTASLVMQMSHLKATSLYNLLHASDLATLSPSNRFFSAANARQRALNLEAKLNICQQVTNAMTYLHDKNIVHGKLTSVNIYIELNQQVKISLMDNDERQLATKTTTTGPEDLRQRRQCRQRAIEFNLPMLTYLSPELVRSIRIDDDNAQGASKSACMHMNLDELTFESDVFSFGTVLFELFEECFPFSQANGGKILPVGQNLNDSADAPLTPNDKSKTIVTPLFTPPLLSMAQRKIHSPLATMTKSGWNGNIKASASELIFLIGSGQTDSRNKHRPMCPALVEHIISACWAPQPNDRPSFKQLSF